ncbi:hypothetical protein HDU85_006195 [Gaertneriomyces sp. JEL0708]|nr:hypothetical protein HDU85_006195 [Gaertneriomyces sp. JEL0708]
MAHDKKSPLTTHSNDSTLAGDGDIEAPSVASKQDARRTLGIWSVTFLIFNRMIGTGVFATPAAILSDAGSVGMSLILWVVGGLIAIAGMTVFLEYGTALPKSGGEKNYLEFVYNRPRLLTSCIYAANAVLLGWAASNSVVFGQYLLFAAGVTPNDWNSRGLGLLCITFAFLIHGLVPKIGIKIQNALGVFKFLVLVFVVLSGFAALAGRSRIGKTTNFENAFEGTTTSAYSLVSAIYNVIWSYIGYSNAHYALGEVRNPVRTIKIAGPLAIGIVTVLYVLANIAYFAAVPKDQILSSGLVVAGEFFVNMFGETFGRRILPLFVVLSALGNVMAVLYSQGRINQELGKEGFLPFSRQLASTWPFGAPFVGLALHYLVSVIMMLAPPPGEVYNFVINVITYPLSIINVLVALGLIILYFRREAYGWNPPFSSPLIVTVFFLLCNLLLVSFPFLKPPTTSKSDIPYWLSSVVGILVLVAGGVYYLAVFVVYSKVAGFTWEARKRIWDDGTSGWEYHKLR